MYSSYEMIAQFLTSAVIFILGMLFTYLVAIVGTIILRRQKDGL